MPEWLATWCRSCSTVLIAVVAASASAVECELTSPAEQALAKMFAPLKGVGFEGAVLFERGGSQQFMTVSWPDAEGRGALRRMNASVNPPIESWPTPSSSSDRICDVLRVYSPALGTKRVVAGRLAQQLSLKPRDPLRLAHVVDLDVETGMALAISQRCNVV